MKKNGQSDTSESLAQWKLLTEGSNEAYTWIYNRYIHQLYQYGCRFCADSEVVKDCIQNLFVNIYQNREKLTVPDNPKLYLMSALRNALFNTLNRNRLHDTYISNTAFDFDLSVEEQFIADEEESSQSQTIAHLLNTLSPRQREIIYYRFYEDLQYDEICRLMDLNYQSAYNLFQRSLIKLRESSGLSVLFFIQINTLCLKNFIFYE
ncbi:MULTISPECIES: sigma-70 family RNA polymerase sigma factor [Bacteroides]|uniref:RNA polymerase sigma factor n=1 Tax=Bacteroides TaxID=816 RepID=UPI0004B7934A|nr:sigma-70 family RNA polymerase sigma factor [Bacteroides neonati]